MIPLFAPRNADFANRVRSSFAAQPMMSHLRAKISRVEAGAVDVEIPFQLQLTQHNGFLHGGTIATLGDTACGYSAYSLLDIDQDVLTVEFKINYLSPGVGERIVAQGRVLRLGRTLIIASGDVFAYTGTEQKHVATMLATMTSVTRPSIP